MAANRFAPFTHSLFQHNFTKSLDDFTHNNMTCIVHIIQVKVYWK